MNIPVEVVWVGWRWKTFC